MAITGKPVLILGAGINGAAVARELLLNGVPVCLVDVGDLARGATAYSSRLIHGGLRYLEYADFALVRESLAERDRLLRLAPQFVKPLRFHVPVQYRASGLLSSALKFLHVRLPFQMHAVPRGLWAVRLGLWWYDFLARNSMLPRHSVRALNGPPLPSVDPDRFRWVCSYHDGQICYPERFVVALLKDGRRLAVENRVSFRVLTYHQAVVRNQRVDLYPISPGEDGEIKRTQYPAISFQPSMIVNATGAWVDRALEQLDVPSSRLMGGTKGSHLLLRNEDLRAALKGDAIYAEADDGRPVFMLPFDSFVLVGTTDLPFDKEPSSAVAEESEVDYLLQSVRGIFPSVDVSRDHIHWHACGVRPLPYSDSSNPASITRRHLLIENSSSPIDVLSLVGGKLTTCRQLAEEAATLIIRKLSGEVRANSRERKIPGGDCYPSDEHDLQNELNRIAEIQQLNVGQVRAVWPLCGTLTDKMLSLPEGGAVIERESESVAGTCLPRRFVQHVINEEWCTHLTDLVERRLMLLFEPGLCVATLRELAALMVDQRELAEPEMEAAIEQCAQRLQTHFGLCL